MKNVAGAAKILLDWYDVHRRKLPWRSPPGVKADPYVVWLSEIMLQQTTVAAVIPYFENFMTKWPDVAALAQAPEQEILAAWAGLGYYARARNLIACAKQAALRGFPEDEAGLLTLPGVGPYTSAAIAAIAFGRRATVVDGNVERVMARLLAIETPLPQAKPEIRAAVAAIAPSARAGDFAQAMMDLGATVCTPKKPACAICPWRGLCQAHKINAAADYPKRIARAPRPERFGAVFVVRRSDGAFLLRTRPAKGLLGGMSEFLGSEWGAAPANAAPPFKAPWRACGGVRHVFTHFALNLEVYAADVALEAPTPKACRWTGGDALQHEPLPSLMRKVFATTPFRQALAIPANARPANARPTNR